MFAAVRSFFIGERGRRLAALFAFEFGVVVLGVFVAQAIADWAGERAEDRRLDLAVERARYDIADALFTAQLYVDLQPCFDAWMVRIMRSAADDQPLDPSWLQRPSLHMATVRSLDDDLLERLALNKGVETADWMRDATFQADQMRERLVQVTDAWQSFALLDTNHGTVRDYDRADVRRAASRIKTLFAGVAINANNLSEAGKYLEIVPKSSWNARPVKSCGAIRERGNTVIYPEE